MEFKLGELFCGPGGLAFGALNAKVDDSSFKIVHAWANDYDRSTCNTYIRNICPDNPESVICKDVHFLDIQSLGDIDALAFGFPCNDFSVVGEQLGFKGKFGPLYSYGVKALNIYKPLWFLAENVGGLKSANNGKAFKKIIKDLKKSGYRLYPNLYKFEEYGIPQARHRVIIIGIREDLPYEFKIPAPTMVTRTCKDAIENPPIPVDAANNEKTKQSDIVVNRLSYIKPGENAFTADIPEHLRLNVNRERARLQTFPDDFVFEGSKEQVRKQIGMAVPAEGARIIFEAILNTFAGIPYPSVESNLN